VSEEASPDNPEFGGVASGCFSSVVGTVGFELVCSATDLSNVAAEEVVTCGVASCCGFAPEDELPLEPLVGLLEGALYSATFTPLMNMFGE
jgi:hypothetical protein